MFSEINFSEVRTTMVFQSVVWMEVFFKINSVFVKIQDLQIWWFTGTQITLPEGKYSTNFYVLFLIACIWKENLVFYIFFCSYWKILSAVLYFNLFCEFNEKQCRWISFIKSTKNDFIESWRFNWRTGHYYFTKIFLNQYKVRKFEQIKVYSWY